MEDPRLTDWNLRSVLLGPLQRTDDSGPIVMPPFAWDGSTFLTEELPLPAPPRNGTLPDLPISPPPGLALEPLGSFAETDPLQRLFPRPSAVEDLSRTSSPNSLRMCRAVTHNHSPATSEAIGADDEDRAPLQAGSSLEPPGASSIGHVSPVDASRAEVENSSSRRVLRSSANYLIHLLEKTSLGCCTLLRNAPVPCLFVAVGAALPVVEAYSFQPVYFLLTVFSSAAVLKQFWKTTEAAGDSSADVIRNLGENSMILVDAVTEIQTDWIRQAGSCGSCLIWASALVVSYLLLARLRRYVQYRHQYYCENLTLENDEMGDDGEPSSPGHPEEALADQFPQEPRPQVMLYVSPYCTNEMLRLLRNAQSKILVALPTLDHQIFVQTLRRRARDGVTIKILLSTVSKSENAARMVTLSKLLKDEVPGEPPEIRIFRNGAMNARAWLLDDRIYVGGSLGGGLPTSRQDLENLLTTTCATVTEEFRRWFNGAWDMAEPADPSNQWTPALRRDSASARLAEETLQNTRGQDWNRSNVTLPQHPIPCHAGRHRSTMIAEAFAESRMPVEVPMGEPAAMLRPRALSEQAAIRRQSSTRLPGLALL